MKLFWQECSKILRIPMIWIYFIGCFLVNYSEIHSGISYLIDDGYLEYCNSIAQEIGWQLGESFEEELEKIADHPYKAQLLSETTGLGNYFKDLDIYEMGQILTDFSGTRGEKNTYLAELLEKKFQILESQVNQIDSVSLLVGSQSQFLFDLLYDILFPNIIVQISILSVIIMMFLTDYEEMNKTNFLVYSTKKGRSIQKIKLLCGCGCSILIHFLLCFLTFTAFFLQYDLSGIFHATMDSPFLSISVWLYAFPFITWGSITCIEYFFGVFLLSTAIILIYTGFSWIISLYCQNMYLSFGVLALSLFLEWSLYLQCVYRPFLVGRYILEGNPLILSQKVHLWFSYMGYSQLFPYSETVGISLFFTATVLLTHMVYQRFKRKDILT